jgi:hypothetical protein
MPLIKLLQIKFPSVFGRPLLHYTLSEVQEMKKLLENPPYHICKKNNTLTATFDVSTDIEHDQFLIDYHVKIKSLEQELFEINNMRK